MAIRILVTLIFILAFTGAKVEASSENDFLIGSGDVVIVQVYNEKDLTVRSKVDNTGMLRIPLIGDIVVVGKTTAQLSTELEVAFLDGYLVSPSVSVTIESFRPFYIRGAVRLSGSYPYAFDLTIDQAIAVAGGLKDRASKEKWFIIRGSDKTKIKAKKDTLVLPGDIIEIEESLF